MAKRMIIAQQSQFSYILDVKKNVEKQLAELFNCDEERLVIKKNEMTSITFLDVSFDPQLITKEIPVIVAVMLKIKPITKIGTHENSINPKIISQLEILEVAFITKIITLESGQVLFVATWLRPHQLNFGNGPTGKQQIAILDKKNKLYVPYAPSGEFEESKDYLELKSTYKIPDKNFHSTWASCDKINCMICEEKEGSVFVACKNCHNENNCICDICYEKLQKCPSCNKEILYRMPITPIDRVLKLTE